MNDDWEAIARETAAAMEAVAQSAARLAQEEVTFRTADGLITIRVTGGGVVNAIEFGPNALRRHDSAALGKRVAEALRAAQLKARKEFGEKFEASIPERVKETDRLIRESVRE